MTKLGNAIFLHTLHRVLIPTVKPAEFSIFLLQAQTQPERNHWDSLACLP